MTFLPGSREQKGYDKLVERKQKLLLEQKTVTNEFNKLLTEKDEHNSDLDGAIENSRKLRKNLEAAIVSAKQPGYFSYHQNSKTVIEMERKNTLSRLTSKIINFEKEILHVTAEMEKIEKQRKSSLENLESPLVGGLKEWFSRYGRPNEHNLVPGLVSEFSENSKVYGGTKHHRAFKSVAVTLKKGRCTR